MSKEYIEREAALSYPFANEKYDHEHADEHFISGCESYKEWLKTIPAADVVERKPITTNADKIRAMTDEELRDMWFFIHDHIIFYSTNSYQGLLDWLKQEVE